MAVSGFEPKTFYQGAAGTGQRVTFSGPKSFVSVMPSGGIVWAKVFAPGQAPPTGSAPTSPIPAANNLVDGWVRIPDGIKWNFGPSDAVQFSQGYVKRQFFQTIVLDIWFEELADLLIVSQ